MNSQSTKELRLIQIFLYFAAAIAHANKVYQKEFVVITASTADYGEALNAAKKASKTLGLKLNLRDLQPDKQCGLIDPKELLQRTKDGARACGHDARSDSDEVSIEYSNWYEGFRKGHYIVVAFTAYKNDFPIRRVARRLGRPLPQIETKSFHMEPHGTLMRHSSQKSPILSQVSTGPHRLIR